MRAVAKERAVLGYFSLFSSIGTLLCCALPSLLVLIGLGATVASFLSAVPWLVTISHHKNWAFAVSGILIAGNVAYSYVIAPKLHAQREACSVNASDACSTASRMSRVVLWVSVALYLIGFFSAYLLGLLLVRLDS